MAAADLLTLDAAYARAAVLQLSGAMRAETRRARRPPFAARSAYFAIIAAISPAAFSFTPIFFTLIAFRSFFRYADYSLATLSFFIFFVIIAAAAAD